MQYSSRLPWHAAQNELTRRLAARNAEGPGAPPLLDLTESNPTRAGIAYDRDALLTPLAGAGVLRYEPSASGIEAARESVAGYYRAQYGCGVDASEILLTASTSEAYAFLFKLLCDPGDEVLVPRPSYPLFEFLASLEAVSVHQYPLRYQEGWWMEAAAWQDLVTERTRAIVVVNPNNPTGSYVKREELEALERFAAARSIAIISDEVFSDYAFVTDPRRVPVLACESASAFSLNGFSKLLGLPQMKLGWILTRNAAAREKLELIADTFLSVSAPVQHAAAAWLALRPAFHEAMMSRLTSNLEWLEAQCRPLRVEGGWYAVLRLPRTRGEEEWAITFLEQDDVLVQPGYFYDFETEAFAVISLLTEPAIFRDGVSRILERIRC